MKMINNKKVREQRADSLSRYSATTTTQTAAPATTTTTATVPASMKGKTTTKNTQHISDNSAKSVSAASSSATTTTTTTTTSNNHAANQHYKISTANSIAVPLPSHRRDNSSYDAKQINKSEQNSYHVKPQRKRTEHSSPDETLHPDACLLYNDNKLISASLDALIQHMVPTHCYYPEKDFIFAFLLCARLFIRPHELLTSITQIWEKQQNEYSHVEDVVDRAIQQLQHQSQQLVQSMPLATSASPQLVQRKMLNAEQLRHQSPPPRTSVQKSAQHCICLLADWIETFPYDFRDERLMQQVRILARKCVYIDNALGKQVSLILQQLVQRLTALEKYEEFLQTLMVTDLSQSFTKGDISLLQHFGTSASASTATAHHMNIASVGGGGTGPLMSPTNKSTHQKHFHFGSSAAATATVPFTCVGGSNSGTSSHADPHDIFGLVDFCPSCEQLAHQLTAIELERLSHIGPEEFVQSFAKEYQSNKDKNGGGSGKQQSATATSASLNDIKKTRNLESYIEWFNRLSYLTASEIVKYPKKKQRVRVIEYWIETARECFNIGNFNSLMAIMAGINLEPISRLKKTWSKVQSAKFEVLEHQMDPSSNFNSYRSTLKAAMWRSAGATNERERIIIPFFSLFVKDLYFLNEGCSNRMPNNHINFEKCSQLAKQVMEFNEWKKVSCPFETQPNVIKYLQTIPVHNENTLSMASFDCEPPDNNEEKGRYKTVKAETKQQLLLKLQQEQQLQQQKQQH